MADAGGSRDAAWWEAVEEAAELLQEERWEDALRELRDVLRKDRGNPYAYNLLGVALFESGRLEPARDAYRAAVRLQPAYLGARVALSHVLRLTGDVRGAVGEAREALRRFPGDGDAMHALGMAHAARGDCDDARRWLEAFLKTRPEAEVADEVRGVLEALGDDEGPADLD